MENALANFAAMIEKIEAESYAKGYAAAQAEMRDFLVKLATPVHDAPVKVKRQRAPRGESASAVVEYIRENPGRTSGQIVEGLSHMKERAVRTALQRANNRKEAHKEGLGWHIGPSYLD